MRIWPEGVELCLFNDAGEETRIPLTEMAGEKPLVEARSIQVLRRV